MGTRELGRRAERTGMLAAAAGLALAPLVGIGTVHALKTSSTTAATSSTSTASGSSTTATTGFGAGTGTSQTASSGS